MTVVAVLRELWDRRLLVAVGLAVATAVFLVTAFSVKPGLPPSFEGRQYQVGIASAGVLVDSPSSLSIDLSGGQSKADVASLSARARLLANLMSTSPLKDQIARRAGVEPDRMIATAPTDGLGAKPSPVATGSTKVKPGDPDANILTVYVNEMLPIITADAQASSPARAAAISSAAIAELTSYLRTVAAVDKVPDARQLVIRQLGPAKSATVQRGPRKLLSVIAFVFVLGLWCAGILIVAALARNWRAASLMDERAPHAETDEAARLTPAPAVPAAPEGSVTPVAPIASLPRRPRPAPAPAEEEEPATARSAPRSAPRTARQAQQELSEHPERPIRAV